MTGERLLRPTQRRQFRIITNEVRQDRSYWDVDGLLEAQDAETLKAVGEKLQELTKLVSLSNEVEISVINSEDLLEFIVALCEGRVP